jgi:hypothetical protein
LRDGAFIFSPVNFIYFDETARRELSRTYNDVYRCLSDLGKEYKNYRHNGTPYAAVAGNHLLEYTSRVHARSGNDFPIAAFGLPVVFSTRHITVNLEKYVDDRSIEARLPSLIRFHIDKIEYTYSSQLTGRQEIRTRYEVKALAFLYDVASYRINISQGGGPAFSIATSDVQREYDQVSNWSDRSI